nr:MAG: hypothetical protein 1 [Betanecrovirus sp.]
MASIMFVVFQLFSLVCVSVAKLVQLCVLNSTQIVVAACCAYCGYLVLRYVLQVRVTLHPATQQTIEDFIRRFQAESMFSEESDNVTVPIGNVDTDLFSDPECKDTKRVRSHKRVSYAVRVAHVAKAQVGLLSSCKANELVYARLCREEMVKHGVRPSHIAHMVPLAVAACFVPLDSDFLSDSIRRCDTMKQRAALLSGASYK